MDGEKIANAKEANKALIDAILNISGNRVSLAGYDTLARKLDYHSLSNNSASLKNIVDKGNKISITDHDTISIPINLIISKHNLLRPPLHTNTNITVRKF